MSGRGDVLHLRLFICGIEVPVIGAMVSATEGSPAAAQIEIIPTDRGLRLLPRSKVHLFFLDYDAVNAGSPREDAEVDPERLIRSDLYKLMFSGELFTINYSKTGFGSRSMVMQCLDDSNLWDTSYLYLLRYANGDTGDGAIVQNTSPFLGALAQTSDVLGNPELLVTQLASSSAAPLTPSLRASGGILGGLFSVLELIGGLPGKYVGVTSWHTIQEARVRLMDQLAGDDGEISRKIYDSQVFQEWLKDRLGDRGTVISFRDVISMINSYIFYGVVPNPVARYVPGSRVPPVWPVDLARGTTGLVPEFDEMVKKVEELVRADFPNVKRNSGYRSNEENAALYREMGLPAPKEDSSAHNLGYAVDLGGHGQQHIGFGWQQTPYKSEEAFTGTTNYSIHRKIRYYQLVHSVGEKVGVAVGDLEQYLTPNDITELKNVKAFYLAIKAAVAQVGGLSWGAAVAPTWGDPPPTDLMCQYLGFEGIDPVHVARIGWSQLSAKNAGSGNATANEAFYKALDPRERMLTQYFRPDCWFVSPPRCNIIFPEEINSFSFTRQMMRETTRLQLMTHNLMIGESALLNQSYFAPTFATTKSLTSAGSGMVSEVVIYPHEKFSGIVPKLERISDVAIYARLTEDHKITEDQKKLDITEKAEEFNEAAQSQIDLWAARTATFNFLSHRYSSRMCTVAGRFMPRIVCGFPALIIDKPAKTSSEIANAQMPVHFMGMVRSVAHSLSQSGGSTNLTLSHARSHKSRDELDDLPDDLFKVQEDRVTSRDYTIVLGEQMAREDYIFVHTLWIAWLDAQKYQRDGSFTFNQVAHAVPPEKGTLSNIRVLNLAGKDFLEEGPAEDKPPVLPEFEDEQASYPDKVIQVGTVGDTERVEMKFRSVTYTISEGEDGRVFALEDAIRPPWFSDQYQNANIGRLYKDFFGCSSLVSLYGNQDIEHSTNSLVAEYSKKSGGGENAATWIYHRTLRAFASLPQVLGDRSQVGFHSWAVGPYEALEHLVLESTGETDEAGNAAKLTSSSFPGTEETIEPKLDPRGERSRRVVAYRNELLSFHGLRG
jgi:hypothetical protein